MPYRVEVTAAKREEAGPSDTLYVQNMDLDVTNDRDAALVGKYVISALFLALSAEEPQRPYRTGVVKTPMGSTLLEKTDYMVVSGPEPEVADEVPRYLETNRAPEGVE